MAARGAWLVFGDEAGFSMTPPTSRTWSKRGRTPVVRVRGRSQRRFSVAALTCYKDGGPSRLIYRPKRHEDHKSAGRRSFTWREYRDLLIAAHRQPGSPIVLIWDNLNVHKDRRLRAFIDAHDWITSFHLPTYAPGLNPVEGIWSLLRRSSHANTAFTDPDHLVRHLRRGLRQLQYRSDLIDGCLAATGLRTTEGRSPRRHHTYKLSNSTKPRAAVGGERRRDFIVGAGAHPPFGPRWATNTDRWRPGCRDRVATAAEGIALVPEHAVAGYDTVEPDSGTDRGGSAVRTIVEQLREWQSQGGSDLWDRAVAVVEGPLRAQGTGIDGIVVAEGAAGLATALYPLAAEHDTDPAQVTDTQLQTLYPEGVKDSDLKPQWEARLKDGVPPSPKTRVFAATADSPTLVGWVSHEAGRYPTAQRYWSYGVYAAGGAGQRDRGVETVTRMSHQMIYLGHPHYALGLLGIAAKHATLPATRALIVSQTGPAHAGPRRRAPGRPAPRYGRRTPRRRPQ